MGAMVCSFTAGFLYRKERTRGENVDEIKAIVWPDKNGSDAGTGDNQAPKWEGRDPRLRFRARTPTSDFPCLHQQFTNPTGACLEMNWVRAANTFEEGQTMVQEKKITKTDCENVVRTMLDSNAR